MGDHEKPAKRIRIWPNSPKKRKGSPRREPVAYGAAIPALITIAAWLGFDLDGETAAAIVAGIVLLAGIVRVRDGLVPRPPEGRIALVQIADDQVVFRRISPVQADLRDIRNLDDLIDPDRADTAIVEQVVGREQQFAGGGTALRLRPGGVISIGHD